MKQKAIRILTPAAAVLTALLVGAGLIASVGVSPLSAYLVLFRGAFGDMRSITDSLVKAIPLIFTGLSFAFAAKCSAYNIGAEGQLYVGALATVAAGVYLTGLPAPVHIPLCLLAGALAGGVWAGIAAWLKVRLGVNEVINTIMLNYVGKLVVSFMVYGPMIENPSKSPQTKPLLDSALLPVLFRGTKLHLGIVVAILACVVFGVIFRRTVLGFELSAVGCNQTGARFAGINVRKNIFLALFISGMLAGLAGAVEMMGPAKRLIIGFSPNYGSDGIAVALLGQLSPLGIFLSAFFLGALRVGANSMQRVAMVPAQVISIIQGLIIIFVIAGEAFTLIAARRMRRKEASANG